MGTTEIVVIAFVALFMGAMGALVMYSNRPEKGKQEQDRGLKKQ